MKVLFQVRIDIAHNYENSCRSIKMMLRNDIDAQRRVGFEYFLLVSVLRKSRHFLNSSDYLRK